MKYLIISLLILLFTFCQTDPFADKRRKTDKYKILAIIGQNTEVRKSISVDYEEYNQYEIRDPYKDGTYIWTVDNKRAVDDTFYLDLIRTQREAGK